MRGILIDHLQEKLLDSTKCSLFLRFKSFFVTFHSTVYDNPFKCKSFVVSYCSSAQTNLEYGNIQLFVKHECEYLVFIQRYSKCSSQLNSFLDIPQQIESKLNELFPLVSLSDHFDLLPVTCLRHKCTLVPFENEFCVSEFRIDFEHDWFSSHFRSRSVVCVRWQLSINMPSNTRRCADYQPMNRTA